MTAPSGNRTTTGAYNRFAMAERGTMTDTREVGGIDALRAARQRIAQMWPALVVVVAVALVAAGQIAEDLADSPPLQMLAPESAVGRWTIIFAVLYMLATARWVDRAVDRWIDLLDGVFTIDRAQFERYARGLRRPRPLVQVSLFVVSSIVVIGLFEVLGSSLPTDDPVTHRPLLMPAMGPSAAIILVAYAVVGWAILSLVYATIQRAQALGQLSHEPIEVDVFDTTKLLPLGNIALATALAPAGIIVILLVGYGRPSQPISWAVLLLAMLAGVLALILPLRGIHRQMSRARYAAIARLNGHLRAMYEEVNSGAEIDMNESALRNNKIAAMTSLRNTVLQMTTWPFRDSLAFGRAVLIASAPLIYTVVSELIKAIWIRPLTGP
jgi:hypothetical protein